MLDASPVDQLTLVAPVLDSEIANSGFEIFNGCFSFGFAVTAHKRSKTNILKLPAIVSNPAYHQSAMLCMMLANCQLKHVPLEFLKVRAIEPPKRHIHKDVCPDLA